MRVIGSLVFLFIAALFLYILTGAVFIEKAAIALLILATFAPIVYMVLNLMGLLPEPKENE